MVSLVAREIAPFNVSIAVLLIHLKEIAHGDLIINVACSVLGLYTPSERPSYLNAAGDFFNERLRARTSSRVLRKERYVAHGVIKEMMLAHIAFAKENENTQRNINSQ